MSTGSGRWKGWRSPGRRKHVTAWAGHAWRHHCRRRPAVPWRTERRHGRSLRLELVELAYWLGCQDLPDLSFHLIVDGLDFRKPFKQKRLQLGTIPAGDFPGLRFLLGRELQGAGRPRQERRRWTVPLQRRLPRGEAIESGASHRS